MTNNANDQSLVAEGPSPNGHAGDGVQDHRDSFATRAIHVGSAPDPVTGAIIPALHTATTYKQSGVGKPIVSGVQVALTPRAVMTTLEDPILLVTPWNLS